MYKEQYKTMILAAKSESRTKGGLQYYESHHIVPDFMFKNRSRIGPRGHLDGNPNSPTNLVLLTFKEHLLAHYLLFKILENTHYSYSAGSALQFFFVHFSTNHIRSKEYTDLTEDDIAFMQECRIIGVDSLSKQRSGKMPAKVKETNELIGSVETSHPKVLSGEWVHISYGIKKPNSGRNMISSNNPNYREITPDIESRLFSCLEQSIDENHMKKKLFDSSLKTEFREYAKVSSVWVVNHYVSLANFVNRYNLVTGSNVLYNPYHRSTSQKESARIHSSSYRKLTSNCGIIKKVKQSDILSFINKNPMFDTKANRDKIHD